MNEKRWQSDTLTNNLYCNLFAKYFQHYLLIYWSLVPRMLSLVYILPVLNVKSWLYNCIIVIFFKFVTFYCLVYTLNLIYNCLCLYSLHSILYWFIASTFFSVSLICFSFFVEVIFGPDLGLLCNLLNKIKQWLSLSKTLTWHPLKICLTFIFLLHLFF